MIPADYSMCANHLVAAGSHTLSTMVQRPVIDDAVVETL